jgi:hypothetical protein
MGRTEFPDLKLIESEPWLGNGTYSTRAKWRALRSARVSTLKKDLTSAGIVRETPDENTLATPRFYNSTEIHIIRDMKGEHVL